MIPSELVGRGRHRQLAVLLPVRRQRALAARIRLGEARLALAAAEAEAAGLEASRAALAARVGSAIDRGERALKHGTDGAAVRAAREQLDWLRVDLRGAETRLGRGREAVDAARRRVDADRQRFLMLDERVAQLERLVARGRGYDNRRAALGLEIEFAERQAVIRARAAR